VKGAVVANQKTRQQRRGEERERAQRLQSRQGSSRRPVLMAVGGVVGLIAVIAALVIAKLVQSDSSPAPAGRSGLAPAAVLRDMATIPAAAFDQVGYVSKNNGVAPPSPIAGPVVQQGGKPLVVYVGADYCPFCAAERWPLVAALERFGSFKTIGATHSATNDVYPNTATFSFHPSSYSSPYLSLSTVELYGNRPVNGSYPPIESPTPLERTLLRRTDPKGTIPFIYFGRYGINGATYNAQLLAGLTMRQIATASRDPVSEIGHSVLGAANLMTAAICQQTGGNPANVCSSTGVTAAAKHLGS
jgi:hypothetical protein